MKALKLYGVPGSSRFPFRPLILFVSLLLIVPHLPAAEAKPAATPAEQYRSLVEQFATAREDYNRAYRTAQTDAERTKAAEKYPQPGTYAARFLTLAEKYPKTPEAAEALVWVAANAYYDAAGEKAIELLARDHLDSPKLAEACSRLEYSQAKSVNKFLRDVLEKNPHREVQGPACLSLARRLGNDSPDEAVKLLNRVIEQFGDLKHYRGDLAAAAKGELFERQNLAIGKLAPEIEGQDVDGRSFKLSDYRGKVVVLDFWGDW